MINLASCDIIPAVMIETEKAMFALSRNRDSDSRLQIDFPSVGKSMVVLRHESSDAARYLEVPDDTKALLLPCAMTLRKAGLEDKIEILDSGDKKETQTTLFSVSAETEEGIQAFLVGLQGTIAKFYEFVGQGVNKPEALRQTRDYLRELSTAGK